MSFHTFLLGNTLDLCKDQLKVFFFGLELITTLTLFKAKLGQKLAKFLLQSLISNLIKLISLTFYVI